MHKAYKISILIFALFTLLLLLSGYMIFELKIGFEAKNVLSYYMGDAKLFTPAKTNSGILKLSLPHIFAFALLAMVVLHFLIFTKFKYNFFVKVLIYGAFISAFFEIFTPFLIINVSELFIYLKIVSFFLYMLLIPIVLSLLFVSITQIKL